MSTKTTQAIHEFLSMYPDAPNGEASDRHHLSTAQIEELLSKYDHGTQLGLVASAATGQKTGPLQATWPENKQPKKEWYDHIEPVQYLTGKTFQAFSRYLSYFLYTSGQTNFNIDLEF